MILKDVVEKLGLKERTASEKLAVEVNGGYASDLLSDVLANAQPGNLWVTLQVHQNVVGVAVVRELAGIVIVNGREPDEETLKRAQEEGIPIMVTSLPTFDVVGRLYQLGVSRAPGR
ncbi:MAG: serine kinase [candidate division Zixibacteria bacterium SM23_81]|nr:MAG: serine kinase [candidate division Zixibacteria bacterium SM23_81]